MKNRYCNVIPYDHNRIMLSSTKSDYINASPFHSDLTDKNYIFSQGPIESTSADFWTMIWEQEASIIVMLTDCIEFGQMK
jgi:protein tyrosine phosphatase